MLALNTIDHIASLLDSIDIKYTHEDRVLRMRWKTNHFPDLKIVIETNEDETWVYIVAPFTNFYGVAEANRMKLAYDMLKESWRVNGVKFAIDDDDDIIVIAETNDTDLTGEEIRTLIGHVVSACDKLWEIYPNEESVERETPIPTVKHVIEREKVVLISCPNCGAKNEQGSIKCAECGAKL